MTNYNKLFTFNKGITSLSNCFIKFKSIDMGTFIINLDKSKNNYTLWNIDNDNGVLKFTPQPINDNAYFDASYQIMQIGSYLLAWGSSQGSGSQKFFPYRLFEFDPTSKDPLNCKPLQLGTWPVNKFWNYRSYYSNNPNEQSILNLIPLGGNFVLFFVPGEGRGTYELWNFDPNFLNPSSSDVAQSATGSVNPHDPLPAVYTPQGGFPSIQSGHTLIPIGNYVLDRFEDGTTCRVWSFDPQNLQPLSIPEVSTGSLTSIDSDSNITVIGDQILSWKPGEPNCKLWAFDPFAQNPLSHLLAEGTLPSDISKDSTLMSVITLDIIETNAHPGSIEYMRSKIKHVVYYMLESRSFDNICGWLYDKNDTDINFIGSDKPFDGASTEYFNMDGNTKVFVSQFNDGKLSNDVVLSDQLQDPFHDNSDALLQMFYTNPGYAGKAKPDMGGFVKNNANHQVMLTFSPEQLPVINGLAKHFAISDEWFSSVPGGTDINRAFSVSGSGLNRLDTWEGGNPYAYWTTYPHRQSIWKVLWNNGISDWKIYNAILWCNYPFTYHLYLQGQVPSLDAMINQQSGEFCAYDPKNFLDSVENFKLQAKNGQLPAFSFLEPVWISPTGTSSYHPGASLVPAEQTLNDIYEAIRSGPDWESTLLVITFSKNGGIYDHASPPYATKPWPNDGLNGFNFDLMGPRVPAILVSPWIKEKTVFRSGEDIPYDSTSFAATLLKWFGIPKSRWGLGDRMQQAPTFESVFMETNARKDAPSFQPPYDKNFPKQ